MGADHGAAEDGKEHSPDCGRPQYPDAGSPPDNTLRATAGLRTDQPRRAGGRFLVHGGELPALSRGERQGVAGDPGIAPLLSLRAAGRPDSVASSRRGRLSAWRAARGRGCRLHAGDDVFRRGRARTHGRWPHRQPPSVAGAVGMPIPRDERSTQETSTVPTSVPRSGACHLLTFDVEHWYEGYRLRGRGGWEAFPPRDPDTVHRLLGLLAEHDQHATFFATGRFAAEFPDVVKAIVADGHEVASHSFDHIPIHRIGGPPAFRDDLHRSVSLLRELTGQPVLGFRAPCWAIADASYRWVLDALADEGLRYD